MRTYDQQSASERRDRRRGPAAPALAPLRTLRSRLAGAGDEQGFLLIEVMVSALMVALIVVGTFNGFDAANQATADQRAHDQASLLAAESQEQLRSEPASALDTLVSHPHTYTKTLNGTVFTIGQEAKTVAASGESTGCSVKEAAANTGANFLVTSTVTWAALETDKATKFKRPGVKDSGIITPPTGSAIEVDVTNGSGTGIPGVTAKASFVPVESGTSNTVEGTTGAAGCVVLSGIQATEATVEIVEKSGFVTPSGALKVPNKVLSIAPNLTTHDEVEYAEAGRIAAHYLYEGKEVTGDTFVAANAGKMKVSPEYEIGGGSTPLCEGAEEQYKFPTGTFATVNQTAACTKYPKGDLFPFVTPWVVYAGDCEANKSAEGEGTGAVTSGTTTAVNVPVAYTEPHVWTGYAKGHEGEETAEALGNVKITNTGCSSAPLPNNSWGFGYTHEQAKTLAKGRLEDPYQPFGSFTLCVASSTLKKAYTVAYTNSKASTPAKPTIYLGQRTSSEQTTELEQIKTKENTIKSEETSAESARKTRETSEETERKTWKSEEESSKGKKPTKAERESKEKEQTKKRETKEKEEEGPRNERQSKLKTLETERKALEKRQTEEKETGVTVEGKSSC